MSSVDLKVVLLGKQYVGKTALVERFLHERFLSEDSYVSTIGSAYGSKRVGTPSAGWVTLGVWDTAGEERFESLTRIYYRGAGAAIICYDITEPSSLERATFWSTELAKWEPACRMYVCGTKLDLAVANPQTRCVPTVAARSFAQGIGAKSVETSSKTGENVAELFATIAEDFAGELPRQHSGGDSGAQAAGTVSEGRVQLRHQQAIGQKQCPC